MIRMTTWPKPNSRLDCATADWNAQHFSVEARGATTALARSLVAAGCPDQPWEAYTPSGVRGLYGKNLFAWSQRMLAEDDRNGLRFVRYREHPMIALQREQNSPDA